MECVLQRVPGDVTDCVRSQRDLDRCGATDSDDAVTRRARELVAGLFF